MRQSLDNWQVVTPTPLIIPGSGTQDIAIRFTPTAAGPAPEGILRFIADGDPMAEITLQGNGIARSVELAPSTVELGDVAIGATQTVD